MALLCYLVLVGLFVSERSISSGKLNKFNPSDMKGSVIQVCETIFYNFEVELKDDPICKRQQHETWFMFVQM